MLARTSRRAALLAGLAVGALLTACGAQTPDAKEHTTATHQAPTATATTSPEIITGCATEAHLPADADGRICQEAPADALQLPTDMLGSAHIMSPSENISCGLYNLAAGKADPYLECVILDPEHAIGIYGQHAPQTGVEDLSDLLMSAPTTVLAYGQAAVNGDFACVSQRIGLACWHTKTKHGVFLSRAQLITW